MKLEERKERKKKNEETGQGEGRCERLNESEPRAKERVLVKHYARLYPRGKFLKRNYVPIEMSVSRKWMGLRRIGDGRIQPPFVPPAAALYPLCQLEVGYRRIDTRESGLLCLSICPLKARNTLEKRTVITAEWESQWFFSFSARRDRVLSRETQRGKSTFARRTSPGIILCETQQG